MDEVLKNLCQAVYKRFPEWDTDELDTFGNFMTKEDNPLYTSDYLFSKIPPRLNGKEEAFFELGRTVINGWFASYITIEDKEILGGGGSTPIKALLQLVIALDNANQLPHEEKE